MPRQRTLLVLCQFQKQKKLEDKGDESLHIHASSYFLLKKENVKINKGKRMLYCINKDKQKHKLFDFLCICGIILI